MKIVKITDEIWRIFRMMIITFPLKIVKQIAVILDIMVQRYESCHYRMYSTCTIYLANNFLLQDNVNILWNVFKHIIQ